MTRLLPVAAIVFALCAPAYALELDIQSFEKSGDFVTLPKKLKWQKVDVATRTQGWKSTVDDKEVERLYSLWDTEIKESHKKAAEDSKFAKYPKNFAPREQILSAKFTINGVEHRFSSASMPDNCHLALPSVFECVWRYEAFNPETQKTIHRQDFQMCATIVGAGEPDDDGVIEFPSSKFRSEFAVDAAKSKIFFRFIADGEIADYCSQAITIK